MITFTYRTSDVSESFVNLGFSLRYKTRGVSPVHAKVELHGEASLQSKGHMLPVAHMVPWKVLKHDLSRNPWTRCNKGDKMNFSSRSRGAVPKVFQPPIHSPPASMPTQTSWKQTYKKTYLFFLLQSFKLYYISYFHLSHHKYAYYCQNLDFFMYCCPTVNIILPRQSIK